MDALMIGDFAGKAMERTMEQIVRMNNFILRMSNSSFQAMSEVHMFNWDRVNEIKSGRDITSVSIEEWDEIESLDNYLHEHFEEWSRF